jgi:hypothetical protein
MNQAYLDPNSYTFTGGFTTSAGKDFIVPESLERSQTMLVRWDIRQLAKGATIDQIEPATLTAVLEIPGFGELDPIEFLIMPSIQARKRVQIISLDPALPYKITLSQIDPLVTNSVLEFYTSDITMSTTTNPANMDVSAITTAIMASGAAQVAATQSASQTSNLKVKRIVESNYTPVLWSGANNHKAVPIDTTDRMGIKLFNNGAVAVAYDTYLDISQKTAAPQQDNIIQPGGETTITADEASMGVLLYTLKAVPNGQTASILITQQYPTMLPTN